MAILLGANAPFILRPEKEQDDRDLDCPWTLVGECYVHGIMDGEVLEYLMQEMGRVGNSDERYVGPQLHEFKIR